MPFWRDWQNRRVCSLEYFWRLFFCLKAWRCPSRSASRMPQSLSLAVKWIKQPLASQFELFKHWSGLYRFWFLYKYMNCLFIVILFSGHDSSGQSLASWTLRLCGLRWGDRGQDLLRARGEAVLWNRLPQTILSHLRLLPKTCVRGKLGQISAKI